MDSKKVMQLIADAHALANRLNPPDDQTLNELQVGELAVECAAMIRTLADLLEGRGKLCRCP